MELKHYSSDKLNKLILSVFNKHLNLNRYKIFFFGSRVRGDSLDGSDIDIGIEGQQKLPADIKLAIEEDLENLPVLYKIEFVDFKGVSTKFRREALKSVEFLN